MALLYTFLCLVLFQILPIFAIKRQVCRPPRLVLNEFQNHYNVKLNNTSIRIDYDFDNIYTKALTDTVMELSLRTARVSFVGYAVPQAKSAAHITRIHFDTKPIFIYRMQQGSKTFCKAESSETFDTSLYLQSKEVEEAIIKLVDICIEYYVCNNYHSMITREFLKNQIQDEQENNSNNLNNKDSLITRDFLQNQIQDKQEINSNNFKNKHTLITHNFLQKQIQDEQEYNSNNPYRVTGNLNIKGAETKSKLISNDSCSDHFNDIYNPQSTINAMMDFGAEVLISKIDNHQNGVFEIPIIHTEFETGFSFWRTTGEFTAANGTFEDLRSIRRIKDMIFTHDDRRFWVASTFKLAPAKLKFGTYKMRYGAINIDGYLSVDIASITMSAKVSFDYNNKPCVASLSHLDIDEISEIDVSMTGLGFFNGQASNIISSQIKSNALDSIRTAIEQQLNELNCERFRLV